MSTRCFLRETRWDGLVEEWFSDAEGRITRKVTQPAASMTKTLDAIKAINPRSENQYYLGSVPMPIAIQWAKACGHNIGTREFAEYAKKQLMDPEWRQLSSGIKV